LLFHLYYSKKRPLTDEPKLAKLARFSSLLWNKNPFFFQERATKTYPGANEFSQHPNTLFYICFNFILHTPVFPSRLFPSGYFTEISYGTSSHCVVNLKTIKPLAVSVEQNVYFSRINPATGTILCSQQVTYRQCVRKQEDKTLQLQSIFIQG